MWGANDYKIYQLECEIASCQSKIEDKIRTIDLFTQKINEERRKIDDNNRRRTTAEQEKAKEEENVRKWNEDKAKNEQSLQQVESAKGILGSAQGSARSATASIASGYSGQGISSALGYCSDGAQKIQNSIRGLETATSQYGKEIGLLTKKIEIAELHIKGLTQQIEKWIKENEYSELMIKVQDRQINNANQEISALNERIDRYRSNIEMLRE